VKTDVQRIYRAHTRTWKKIRASFP